MNTSTITDALADRVPSRSAAASTISSTFDDVTGRLPDVELPDFSKTARRTRRAVARVVPGMSTSRFDDVRSRASSRWVLMIAVVVAVVAVATVLRRRSASEPDQRRDDWMTTPSGDSRPAEPRDREPATSRA